MCVSWYLSTVQEVRDATRHQEQVYVLDAVGAHGKRHAAFCDLIRLLVIGRFDEIFELAKQLQSECVLPIPVYAIIHKRRVVQLT
jgi:hypothetical protein